VKRRPTEPLAWNVAGAFALVFLLGAGFLATLAWQVIVTAWPGTLAQIVVDGSPTCSERLSHDASGDWVRLSGRPDAWLLPTSRGRELPRNASLRLRDGRWFCLDSLALRDGEHDVVPAMEQLQDWMRQFAQDERNLRRRARSGDTASSSESRRLNALARTIEVRWSLGQEFHRASILDVESFRPPLVTPWDRICLFSGNITEQFTAPSGTLAALLGTTLVTVLATLLASPLGLAAAIWLTEFSRPGIFSSLFHHSVQLLAGIPPIVFGTFGLVFLVRDAGNRLGGDLARPSLFWTALTLALLALPTVTRQARLSLLQVPHHLREASMAAGASRLQTFRRVVFPTVRKGFWAAILIGAVQAMAETAPLLLTGAVQLSGHALLDGNFPWLHPLGGFEHLGTRIFHNLEQQPPGPLGAGSAALACLLLASCTVAMRTLAAALRQTPRRP
jgi:ABC-type phosphate transport system permease subunit